MFGLSSVPSTSTRWSKSSVKSAFSTREVTWYDCARSCACRPSAPPARRSARSPPPGRAPRSGRARARSSRCSTRSAALSVIEYVARHFAKRAPRPWYSFEPFAQPVEALVIVSPSASASGFAPRSTLMPGMMPFDGEQLRERRPVGGALPDRLVVEDDAADELLGAGRREEQLAVGAAGLLGRLDARSSRSAS